MTITTSDPGTPRSGTPDAGGERTQLPELSQRHFERIQEHAARLFNEGLEAAREGQLDDARDRFAAIVHWYPYDLEARNALALACLEYGDAEEARRQWEFVLDRRPRDPFARRGLLSFAGAAAAAVEVTAVQVAAEAAAVSPTEPG